MKIHGKVPNLAGVEQGYFRFTVFLHDKIFGLMKPLIRKPRRRQDRYEAYAERALTAMREWIGEFS